MKIFGKKSDEENEKENSNFNKSNIDKSDNVLVNNFFSKNLENVVENLNTLNEQTKENTASDNFCRICKEDGYKDNELICVCECKGLISYSHPYCMLYFLKDVLVFRNERKKCEICNSCYRYEVFYDKKCKFSNEKNVIKFLFFLILFSIIFCIFSTLLIKNILDFKYNFIEFILISIFFNLMVAIIYYFRDILGYEYLEKWVFYHKINDENEFEVSSRNNIGYGSMSGETYNTFQTKQCEENIEINNKNIETEKNSMIYNNDKYIAKSYSNKKSNKILSFKQISNFFSPQKEIYNSSTKILSANTKFNNNINLK